MKLFLAGEAYGSKLFPVYASKMRRLDSFFYVRNKQQEAARIPHYKDYLLDSGAFTFMMSKKVKVNIDLFTDEYIDFIKSNSVSHFFEMDVDSVLGYDKVKILRSRIEQKTGRPVIPVFHLDRGIDDWKSMCADYSYIAIGMAGKDFAWGDWRKMMPFVEYANSKGVKVHGLGITGMKSLERVPFYSVDSSSWTAANRYKTLHLFKEGRIVSKDVTSMRIKNHLKLAEHQLKTWMSFSDYMNERKLL